MRALKSEDKKGVRVSRQSLYNVVCVQENLHDKG